jgi:ribosomal protein S18 acetylase RimI-like enzyme
VSGTGLVVRRAEPRDLPRLGALAGALVRFHHASDPARFLLVEGVEAGYARWLGSELERREAVVLAAELDGEVVGYGYATLEGRDWGSLLDDHGEIHDVMVLESARRSGAGRALLRELVAELEALGAPRIVLYTMTSNVPAQRLFEAEGFRRTMLELTRDRP